MSTQTITIGRGQGITQAIAQQLELTKDELKRLDSNIWSDVLKEIKKDNNSKTKFRDAETQYDPSSNNFKGWNVQEKEKISLDNTTLSKIKQLIDNKLKGASKAPVVTPPPAITTSNPTVEAPNITIKGIEVNPPEEQPLVATGKQLTRYVDGQKQTIEIGQNDNGQKTRYLVNEDGTRGEELVTMTTVGKNTYQTKSKFEAEVKSVLGLGDKEEIPKDLKPFYVEIGGEAQLMFKSSQGTLTPKQALALVNKNKSASTPPTDITQVTTDNATNNSPETTPASGNSTTLSGGILNIAKRYAIEMDYKFNNKDLSQLDNGAEIIYNGTPCHVSKDRTGIHLIDNSKNKIYTEAFREGSDVEAPPKKEKPAVRTTPTPTATNQSSQYIKTGPLEPSTTSGQHYWTKNGELE